jgi:hypothetical protein
LLGQAPQAHTAFAPLQYSTPPPQQWDSSALVAALNQMSMNQGGAPWVMDTGATAHMNSNDGILTFRSIPSSPSVVVGDGNSLSVTGQGNSFLSTPSSNFALNNVLIVPSIIRNLLSVRQFTRDNNCSVEFDALGFSIKDPRTSRVMLRCNSSGDLYTFPAATHQAYAAASNVASLWHCRLGHPSPAVSTRLQHLVPCNRSFTSICHACQLGKHVRLPFSSSSSCTSAPFELLHCDVWTSPVSSVSGNSYYLVILDDYTHYCWTFPLRRKSDVHQHLVQFCAFARTQFSLPVKCFQADNGTEFVNNASANFLASNGILLLFLAPTLQPRMARLNMSCALSII